MEGLVGSISLYIAGVITGWLMGLLSLLVAVVLERGRRAAPPTPAPRIPPPPHYPTKKEPSSSGNKN